MMIGAEICIDYWWNLRNHEETSADYLQSIEKIHCRCAERILHGCLKNGGLYIKLGQGLVNLDHLLPKEYTQTLKVINANFFRSPVLSNLRDIVLTEINKC